MEKKEESKGGDPEEKVEESEAQHTEDPQESERNKKELTEAKKKSNSIYLIQYILESTCCHIF